MEALTGSWPWQTYAYYAINFQARIALSPSVRFGLGGMLFLYVLQPLFEKAIDALNNKGITLIFFALLAIFTLDFIIKVLSML
jgi:uncharacterized membrane protein